MDIIRQITVEGDPYVKKNGSKSNRFGGYYRKKNKKNIDPFEQWEKSALIQLSIQRPLECDWPIAMHVKFYTKTRKMFDYTNMAEGIQDVLKKAEVIPDDNTKYIEPVFSGEYGGREIDKDNPRIVVTFIQ